MQPLLNALSNWVAFAVNAIAGFFLAPFIVQSLGDDSYGAWALIGSLIGYLGLLDLGVRSAVTRYVANYQSAARHAELARLVSAGLVLFALAGAAALLAGAALALWGLPLFEIDDSLLEPARAALVIASGGVAVSMLSGVFQAVVVGMQRFTALNLVSVVSTLVRVGVTVLALQAGGRLIALALIQLVLNGAIGLAMLWVSRRVYPELQIHTGRGVHTGRGGLGEARPLLVFGLTTSVLHFSGALVNYADPAVIAALLPISQVTFFAIAASLIEYSRQLVTAISHLIAPHVSSLEGGGRAAEANRAILTAARFATLVSLTMVITFIWRGSSFLALWMGPSYAAPSGAVLAVLAWTRWCGASFHVTSNALIGLARHRGLVPAALVEAGANLALSVWLARHYGIVGVALGTLVPRLLMAVVFMPWYLRLTTGIAVGRYLREAIARPSLAMLPFAAATLWVERSWPAGGLAMFFGQVAWTLPVAVAGAWWVALEPSERALARELAARVLGRARPG